jgi:uncharacterized membrane protein HdeD (DUF308 family)
MSATAQFSIALALAIFALAYCMVQTIRDFRQRRFVSASAGVISSLVLLLVAVTAAYNLALTCNYQTFRVDRVL